MTPEWREHRRVLAVGYRRRKGTTPRPPRPFSIEPLIEYALQLVPLGTYVNSETADVYRLLGINRARAYQWRANGIDPYIADRLSVRLGVHPSAIWGQEWFTAADLEETG